MQCLHHALYIHYILKKKPNSNVKSHSCPVSRCTANILPNLLVYTCCVKCWGGKRVHKQLVCAHAHTWLFLSQLKNGANWNAVDMNICMFRDFCGLKSDFQIISSVKKKKKKRHKSSKVSMAFPSGKKEIWLDQSHIPFAAANSRKTQV